MAGLALIAGTALRDSDFSAGARTVEVATERGAVEVLDAGGYTVLQRHGLAQYRPPHAIDFRANMLALAKLGCERVLAVGSVGSLHPELSPGTFLAPADFVAPQLGISLFDDVRGHVVPGFDPAWRRRVVSAWQEQAAPELRDGGVYRQMPGPRFETPAEVSMLAASADVVGMTVASECVLACELSLPYAAICVVDNLANGVAAEPLAPQEFAAGVAANRERLIEALSATLPVLV